jgi:predicted enzyme related to lactoylglutathione lyase
LVSITHVFAGIAVADYDTMRAWYERLFGRPADVIPNEQEAVWQITETGLVYIVADAERAGRAALTLIVDDLDEHLSALETRGLVPSEIEALPGIGRKAVITDPDGNTISFAELRSPGA